MTDYSQIEELRLFYLEDSWVLDVVARPGILAVTLDVVLLPQHPDHQPPQPGEAYCYRRGELIFAGVTNLRWTRQGLPPAKDTSGDLDYGGVDLLTLDQGAYRMSGDFGEIVVHAKSVQMQLRGNS
ncbi:hypothetical protein ACFQZ8_00240 [Micromonospora azadirachtae]|uniref:Uncharacterized protein n=1 Tax=Micromonospora azadirachtae TaxID=1970735 RepID=A0ABW2ZUM8_9ACTN